MQASQLRPAGQLAQKLGVKAMVYGPPGTGKTPAINTAPRPVLLASEPGLLSMRGSNVPTWEGYTAPKIREFFEWLFSSAEAKNYDTVGADSLSQIAEIVLMDQLARNRDGRKAYGEMSRIVMEWVDGLYFMPAKHTWLVCKEGTIEEKTYTFGPTGVPVESTTYKKRPYFPGNDLNIKVPHRYDAILRMERANVPGMQGLQRVIRCHETDTVIARDRSGRLAEIEPPDLNALFAKAMQ